MKIKRELFLKIIAGGIASIRKAKLRSDVFVIDEKEFEGHLNAIGIEIEEPDYFKKARDIWENSVDLSYDRKIYTEHSKVRYMKDCYEKAIEQLKNKV